jgi:hypothetical protein
MQVRRQSTIPEGSLTPMFLMFASFIVLFLVSMT